MSVSSSPTLTISPGVAIGRFDIWEGCGRAAADPGLAQNTRAEARDFSHLRGPAPPRAVALLARPPGARLALLQAEGVPVGAPFDVEHDGAGGAAPADALRGGPAPPC